VIIGPFCFYDDYVEFVEGRHFDRARKVSFSRGNLSVTVDGPFITRQKVATRPKQMLILTMKLSFIL
jgi:hypothetical protein